MSAKVIIVTGASRGIGHAISTHLLETPSTRLVLLARSTDALKSIQAFSPDPSRVELVAGDVADSAIGQKAVDVALAKWGRLDALILNHGAIAPVAKIADADLHAWTKAFDTNVFSIVAMIKAAIPALRQSHGSILLTSSGAAITGYVGWGSYGAAKAVLNHLPLTLQKEEPEITTIAIRPGVVDTGMQAELAEKHFGNMDPKDVEKFRSARTEGKMLRPEQPGNVMARLALDTPNDLNGAFLSWNDEKLARFQDANVSGHIEQMNSALNEHTSKFFRRKVK